jgi:hypothetical protein
MCYALQRDSTAKNGQIAHLDRDRSNSDPDNLAWLCLAHHDDYDTRRRQTRNFTAGEVKRYRSELFAAIAEGRAPSALHLTGAALNMSCYLAVVKSRTNLSADCGAFLYLGLRVSNKGTAATGLEHLRFYFRGKEVRGTLCVSKKESGYADLPDEGLWGKDSVFLTLGHSQLIEPGRVFRMVLQVAFDARVAFRKYLEPLYDGAAEVKLRTPIVVEIEPVIGSRAAAHVDLIRQR